MAMQGGVGKLTADSISMGYMHHWWSYVTATDVFVRSIVTHFSLMYFLCPPAAGPARGLVSFPAHRASQGEVKSTDKQENKSVV